MIFTETRLAGAFVIDVEPHADDRGFFARAFCEEELRARGLDAHIAQCNISWNRVRGTLRGLHYQAAPHEETKIVRCTRGAIWDVIVDLRPDSVTRNQWVAETLTADNRKMLYIPHGFAHGFITLADDSELFYSMGTAFAAGAGRGVAWNDPAFGIEWPIAPVVMAERDRTYERWLG